MTTTIDGPSVHKRAGVAASQAPASVRRLSPELGFDLVRVYLGLGLAVRGVIFLLDPSWVGEQLNGASSLVWLGRLVAGGHLVGGVLLALGWLTRAAALVQLVPVLGAVLLVHRDDGLLSPAQSLEFALLVLAMLIFYAAFGAGRLSLDHQLERRAAAR